jgi:hypothetical protein
MMIAGSVTVNADQTYSGSGLAVLRYAAQVALMPPFHADPAVPPPSWTPASEASTPWATAAAGLNAQYLAMFRAIAATTTALAAVDVAYWQAHAVAHVTSEVLGRIPASTAQHTPIEPPAAPVDVPIQ